MINKNILYAAIVFVYDYHPGSETLWARHFSPTEGTGPAPFSTDPTAPRPYSHTKNTLLRHQHSSMLPENLLWNYIIQVRDFIDMNISLASLALGFSINVLMLIDF